LPLFGCGFHPLELLSRLSAVRDDEYENGPTSESINYDEKNAKNNKETAVQKKQSDASSAIHPSFTRIVW